MQINWQKALECEQRVQQILVRQEIDGIQFDIKKANELVEKIQTEQESIYNSIRPKLTLEIECLETKLKQPVTLNGVTVEPGSQGFLKAIFLKNGSYTSSVIKWLEDSQLTDQYMSGHLTISGPFTRVKFIEPELSKRVKLANQLIKLGWKPVEFTETGEPKLTNKGVPVDTLEKIEGDIGKQLARWFTIGHRLGVIKGWIKNIRPDSRLSAYCTGNTTNTGRRKHKLVANLPKAKDSVVLGKEMRSLFIARPGYKLVGYDAAGLEARVMGHYTYPIDNGTFANELLNGDIHSKTVEWVSEIWKIDRDIAKNCFYGLN